MKQKKEDWSGLAIAGMVCACLSALFVPPLFGVVAIILGALAENNGDPNGRTVWILGIILMLVGMILGAIFMAAVSAAPIAMLPAALVLV